VGCGENNLATILTRDFDLSLQQKDNINRMGFWSGDTWAWELEWRRSLFVLEEELKEELMTMLSHISLRRLEDDSWLG